MDDVKFVLREENGFSEKFKKALPSSPIDITYITSNPNDKATTEYYAGWNKTQLENSGIRINSYTILDSENEKLASKLVLSSELVILAGGHVPTQNTFFEKIGLKDILKSYNGVILGISAGTMNSAKTVYSPPEFEEEAANQNFQKYYSGLGLTETIIIPHYQKCKDDMLCNMRVYEDIIYHDSIGKSFYAIPDGTYLYIENGKEEFFGERYLIENGKMRGKII